MVAGGWLVLLGSHRAAPSAVPAAVSGGSQGSLGSLGSQAPSRSDRAEPTLSEGAPSEVPTHTDPDPATSTGPTTNRLMISSLHVDAPIIEEPIHGNELMIPSDVHTVGHWNGGGAIAGGAGTVLIAGHVNYQGQGNGALFQLAQLQPGATIQTVDAAAVWSWRVISVRLAQKSALPQDIFTGVGPRRLVVITCGGPLIHVSGGAGGYNTYRDNVIVTAVPA